MEAVNVAWNANTGFLLFLTYNIGTSGHNIYRCVDNAMDAFRCYKPENYLVIETDRVELDMEEMQAVIDGKAQKLPSYDSGIVYQMQRIPAVKWIYKQTLQWANQGKEENEIEAYRDDSMDADYQIVLAEFLSGVKDAVCDSECQPIIFYHPMTVLNSDGSFMKTTNALYLETFELACEENGIIFIGLAYVGDTAFIYGSF